MTIVTKLKNFITFDSKTQFKYLSCSMSLLHMWTAYHMSASGPCVAHVFKSTVVIFVL